MISLKVFVFFTVITGVFYPALVTIIAQIAFPEKSNGSLLMKNNRIIGSQLIGQVFDSTIYFSSRPSAIEYNPLPSGGSNFGLTNSKLKEFVCLRRKEFIKDNQLDSLAEVPSEMLFASASGLDPHIKPQSAILQVIRIVKARKFSEAQKQQLINIIIGLTEKPQLMFLGEERINVLLLNLKLDEIK